MILWRFWKVQKGFEYLTQIGNPELASSKKSDLEIIYLFKGGGKKDCVGF